MFNNEKERGIFFERMLPVFAFNKETVKRLEKETKKPTIDDPIMKDLLTEENNYQLILQPTLKELAKHILLLYSVPFGYEAYQTGNYEYIIERGTRMDNQINNRIENYKLVVSKNIKDFIFCSSTSGFTSCFSLYSSYDACAWRGIPTLFLDPTQFIVFVKSTDKNKNKVKLYGVETYKMNARAFTHSVLLPRNNNYRSLIAGRIYGEYSLLISCLLATEIPGYSKIFTLEDRFAMGYNFPMKRYKTAICAVTSKEVHPYYDRIRIDGNDRRLQNNGSGYYNTIHYNMGNSFEKLYQNGASIKRAVDGSCDEDEEEQLDLYCDICGNGYYEDDDYCNYYDTVDLGSGLCERVLCNACRDRLINPGNDYDIYTVLDYNIHLAYLWLGDYEETHIMNCDMYRETENERIPEIKNTSYNAYDVLKETVRLDQEEIYVEDLSADSIRNIKIYSTFNSKKRLLTELWDNEELQRTPEPRMSYRIYPDKGALLEKAYDPALILLESKTDGNRQVIQIYLAQGIGTNNIKAIFNNAITEYENSSIDKFQAMDAFIYFVNYVIVKPTERGFDLVLDVPRNDGQVVSLSKMKNKGRITFHDRFHGDVTKINNDEGGYFFKSRPRATGVYDG